MKVLRPSVKYDLGDTRGWPLKSGAGPADIKDKELAELCKGERASSFFPLPFSKQISIISITNVTAIRGSALAGLKKAVPAIMDGL